MNLEEKIKEMGFYFRTLTLHSDGTFTCNFAKHLKKTSNSEHSRYEKTMTHAKTAMGALLKAQTKIKEYKLKNKDKKYDDC